MKLVIKQHGLFINIPSIPPFRTPAEVDISKVPINMVIGEMRKNGIYKYEIKTKNIELLKNTISKLVNKTEMKKIKVSYEKDGIMKLNAVVREMFFKHIPFKAEIREQLESMPAFTKYANRYKNVNARDIAAYERKFKKYQDETGKYPPEIEKYFEFMKKQDSNAGYK